MSDEIVEDFLGEAHPNTPINYNNCRALTGRKHRQCAHKVVREEQGKGICRVHYAALKRGTIVMFQREPLVIDIPEKTEQESIHE